MPAARLRHHSLLPCVQARELKSVYIKARGAFLKLIIHKCFINPLNLFNQVS